MENSGGESRMLGSQNIQETMYTREFKYIQEFISVEASKLLQELEKNLSIILNHDKINEFIKEAD